MNFKSTLYLAFALAVLAFGYVLLRSNAGSANDTTSKQTPSFKGSPMTQDLIETEEQPGDLVKIVARRKGGEEWIFEKRDMEEEKPGTKDEKRWQMTAPIEMVVAAYDVDRIGRQIRNLTYEVSYKTSESGAPTLADAGLDPPESVVTLSDADGKSVTLEIGRVASEQEVYVRLAGRDEIFVAKSPLKNLFKETALEYREKQLWSFAPEDVKRIEIIDRSDAAGPVHYAFAKKDGRWMMESPVTARATSKLDDLARSLGSLRAVAWYDNRPELLASYGLKPAAWTIKATVEETIVPESKGSEQSANENEETEEEPSPPETTVREYELHLSDRTPIGEDTKVYMRIGDESVAGSIMKYAADKFKPDLSQWRDMSVAMVNVTGATRVVLTTPDGGVTLVKAEGTWSFEADGNRAEDAAVRGLLESIQSLKAVAFVDGAPSDPAKLGLDKPRTLIKLTIPGVEEAERFAVGGFTEPTTKRLVYVRRNEVASIAKVRASDAAALTKGLSVFQNRTIVDIPSSQIDRVALSTDDHCTGTPTIVKFEQSDDGWKITSPVEASVRDEMISGLVDALARLRAESVVPASEQSVLGSLKTPVARVVVEYRVPGKPDDDPDESAEDHAEAPKNVEKRATLTLVIAAHGGRYYVQRTDRPTAYEVSMDFFDKFFAEYRTSEVLTFDDSSVDEFAIRNHQQDHGFVRKGKEWTYQPEPDLPLDAAKVDNLLLQLKDLETHRYLGNPNADLETLGLTNPAHNVTITLDDGTTRTLLVSDKTCTRYPEDGFYATVPGRGDVFLLMPDVVNRFTVTLDELERKP